MTLQRHATDPRPNWYTTVKVQNGLVYIDTVGPDGEKFSYWNETGYYSLSPDDEPEVRKATAMLQEMFIEVGDYIIANNLFHKLGIPDWVVPAIKLTWQDDALHQYWPSVYGRFDLAMGTNGDIKLLEYNADTPTCLPESTGVQWRWHTDKPGGTQLNDVYPQLRDAWKRNLALYQQRTGNQVPLVHVAFDETDKSGEDCINAGWMEAAIQEAGYRTKLITMRSIQFTGETQDGEKVYSSLSPGVQAEIGEFTDADDEPIQIIFKLYPWEWMIWQPFGPSAVWNMLHSKTPTMWVEPIYKMLWSNKGVLPLLWQLFGNHPVKSQYLLPAYFEGEEPAGFRQGNYVRKPLLGREGGSTTIIVEGQPVEAQSGEYGAEGYVLQTLFPLPEFQTEYGTVHPVMGAWMIDNDPKGTCGICFRESTGLVTTDQSRFVPHKIQ